MAREMIRSGGRPGAAPTATAWILAVGLLSAPLVGGCERGAGQGRCAAPVELRFSGLTDAPLTLLYYEQAQLELQQGYAQGLHDGERWTLLLAQGAVMSAEPSCDATEVELVLDQRQVGLELQLYRTPQSDEALHSASSRLEAQPIPDDYPYERWIVTLPQGQAGYLELEVQGGGDCIPVSPKPGEPSGCDVVLIRSLTFR
jgi:hypothetical protein